MEQFSILDTKFGYLGICTTKTKVRKIIYPNDLTFITKDITHPNNHTIFMNKVIDQLNNYLAGDLKNFDVEYELSVSPFYEKVLNEVCKIPYGETATYKRIAKKIKNSFAYRAVANANANNPIPIIIPCHRVILSNGSSGGYGGGAKLKKELIKFEKISSKI